MSERDTFRSKYQAFLEKCPCWACLAPTRGAVAGIGWTMDRPCEWEAAFSSAWITLFSVNVLRIASDVIWCVSSKCLPLLRCKPWALAILSTNAWIFPQGLLVGHRVQAAAVHFKDLWFRKAPCGTWPAAPAACRCRPLRDDVLPWACSAGVRP